MIRDRIKRLVRIPTARLRPHPRNWRIHGPSQREHLAAVLREIGLADALLGNGYADNCLGRRLCLVGLKGILGSRLAKARLEIAIDEAKD
jgi:hypothetical protein